MGNNIQTLEQRRAKSAYDCIENTLKIIEENKKNEFSSHVKNVPMLIKTNGLGATFAFMLSKGKDYLHIGNCLLFWLKETENKIIDLENVKDFETLTKKIMEISSFEYRALTKEVLAYLNWTKRFVEGLTKKE